MKDELLAKFDMHLAVKTYLQVPANKALWFNLAPTIFTTLEGQFETAATNLGTFGDSQSAPITGTTEQQNAAEKALEDAARPRATESTEPPSMNNALSLTLTLSRKERDQRSPRAEALDTSPFAHRGLRPSLPQRGRAGVREKSCGTPPSRVCPSLLLLGCWLLLVPAVLPVKVNAASGGTVVAWGAGKTSIGAWPEFGQSIVPTGLTGW